MVALPREHIRYNELVPWHVFQPEVESSEIKVHPHLPQRQSLCVLVVVEVVMITPYQDWGRVPLQVVPPVLQSRMYGQKLLIINFVVLLGLI